MYYPAARGAVPDQRSGPRKACRAWSGWVWGCGRTRDTGTAAGTVRPTLRARSVPCRPSLVFPQNAASWPIRARFHLNSTKLSQNGQVSLKYVEKACNSPCFQNGPGKSPLGILGFPFYLAFSHKELMGHFDPESRFIVKMMKCRQYVHPCNTRKGRQIPPRPREPARFCGRSSSDSAREQSTVFSTD